MANIESAREHIEKQIENIDSPVGQVGAICLAWLEYAPETAAPLLMAEDKTLEGALGFMRTQAGKIRGKESAVIVGPMQAMEQVFEYFGCDDPIGGVEGGFAYFCMQKEAAKVPPRKYATGCGFAAGGTACPCIRTGSQTEKAVTLNLEDLGL